MSVNEAYYGPAASWSDASTTYGPGKIQCKIATITSSTANVECGSYQYLWGKEFSETGNSIITVDRSFCYIAMDKDAPQNKVRLSSGCISGTADITDRYAMIDVIPTKDVPFGWSLNGSSYGQQINTDNVYNYNTWGNAPVNYRPLFLSPTWTPENYNDGHWYLRYFGYQCAPVLSWSGYKSVKLVPIIFCAELKAGKTAADVAAIASYSDVYQVFQGLDIYDLKTYLTGTVNVGGVDTPICDIKPYVFQVGVLPIKISFTGGVASAYDPVDAGSIGNGTGTWYPSSMYDESFDFAVQYKANPSSYGAQIAGTKMIPALVSRKSSYGAYANCYQTTPGIISQFVMGSVHWVASGVTTISTYYSGREYVEDEIYDPDTWHVIEANQGGNAYTGAIFTFTYGHIEDDFGGTDAFRVYCRRMLAYYGMFFSDGIYNTIPESEDMDTVGCFLGTVDAQGVTHGDYTEGPNNPDNGNYGWTDPAADTPYTPGGGGGGGDETEDPSDPLALNTAADNGFGIAFRYYVIDRGDLTDLQNWMSYYLNYNLAHQAAQLAGTEAAFLASYPDAQAWQAEIYASMGTGASPYQDIVGVMCYPFDLTSHISTTAAGYRVGTHRTNVYYYDFDQLVSAGILTADDLIFTGDAVTSSGFAVIDLGSMDIEQRFGDFRDYAPYCRLELQVPYHGTVDIDPADWIVTSGTPYTLSVQAIVDLATGSSLAVILRNSDPMITIPGQMGISVPITADALTGTASSLMLASVATQNSRISSAAQFLTGAVGIAEGAAQIATAGGDPTKLISGIAGTTKSAIGTVSTALQGLASYQGTKWAAEHMAGGKMVTGGNTPSTSFYYETKCRLVRHYPAILGTQDLQTYRDTVGGACNVTAQIGSFDGLTVFDSAILTGITATDDELAMIMQALTAGVIL